MLLALNVDANILPVTVKLPVIIALLAVIDGTIKADADITEAVIAGTIKADADITDAVIDDAIMAEAEKGALSLIPLVESKLKLYSIED
jgi:hypothetical protein